MSVQLSDNGVLPVVRALEAKAASIRQGELKKAFGHLGRLSEDERDTIVALATAITDRILSLPLRRLDGDRSGSYDGLLRELFDLDGAIEGPLRKANGRSQMGLMGRVMAAAAGGEAGRREADQEGFTGGDYR